MTNIPISPAIITDAHLYCRMAKVRKALRICDTRNSCRGGLDFPSFVKAYACIFYPKVGADGINSQLDDTSEESSILWDGDRAKGGRENGGNHVSSQRPRNRGLSKERRSKLGFRARNGSEGGKSISDRGSWRRRVCVQIFAAVGT